MKMVLLGKVADGVAVEGKVINVAGVSVGVAVLVLVEELVAVGVAVSVLVAVEVGVGEFEDKERLNTDMNPAPFGNFPRAFGVRTSP